MKTSKLIVLPLPVIYASESPAGTKGRGAPSSSLLRASCCATQFPYSPQLVGGGVCRGDSQGYARHARMVVCALGASVLPLGALPATRHWTESGVLGGALAQQRAHMCLSGRRREGPALRLWCMTSSPLQAERALSDADLLKGRVIVKRKTTTQSRKKQERQNVLP